MNPKKLAGLLSTLLLLPAIPLAEPVLSDRLAVGIPVSGNLQGELVELQAEGGAFLAIFQARQRGKPRGGIVLLHDRATRANSLEVMRPLRLGLADAGWDTLSLQLPTDQTGEQTLIQARLQAGLEWLRVRRPPSLVVIAQGGSGIAALTHASQQTPGQIQALVLVSMPLDAETGDATGALFGQVRVPVMDVYAERDHGPVVDSAADRKSAAATGQANDYTQIEIPGATAGFFGQEGSLLSRIRGWLTKTTAGLVTGAD